MKSTAPFIILSLAVICFSATLDDTDYVVEKDDPIPERNANRINISKMDNSLKGLSEIAVAGSLSFISENNSSSGSNPVPTLSTMMLALQFGRFISNPLEIGGRFSVSKTNYTDVMGQYGAFLSYHFADFIKSKVPYITANYQLSFNYPFDQSSYLIGAGVKNLIGNACLSIEAYYMNYMFSTAEDSHNLNITGLQLGMSYLF